MGCTLYALQYHQPQQVGGSHTRLSTHTQGSPHVVDLPESLKPPKMRSWFPCRAMRCPERPLGPPLPGSCSHAQVATCSLHRSLKCLNFSCTHSARRRAPHGHAALCRPSQWVRCSCMQAMKASRAGLQRSYTAPRCVQCRALGQTRMLRRCSCTALSRCTGCNPRSAVIGARLWHTLSSPFQLRGGGT